MDKFLNIIARILNKLFDFIMCIMFACTFLCFLPFFLALYSFAWAGERMSKGDYRKDYYSTMEF